MIKHQIKLAGPGVSGTRVSAHVLRDLLNIVVGGSQRAVRLRTQGRSTARGQPPRWIQVVSEFTVQVLEGSTVLAIEAPSLCEAAPEKFEYRGLFPEIDPKLSSFDYFVKSLSAAMTGDEQSNLYDQPLLVFLRNFNAVFDHGVESIAVRVREENESQDLQIQRSDLQRFFSLESKSPELRQVRLNKPTVQAISRQSQGPRSGLKTIFGQWPGDETDDEIAAELEHLS